MKEGWYWATLIAFGQRERTIVFVEEGGELIEMIADEVPYSLSDFVDFVPVRPEVEPIKELPPPLWRRILQFCRKATGGRLL